MILRRIWAFLLIGAASCFVLDDRGLHAQEAAAKVEVKSVKYDQLVEAVKAHRGKVILIDVWSTD
jgi:hypothetical protein